MKKNFTRVLALAMFAAIAAPAPAALAFKGKKKAKKIKKAQTAQAAQKAQKAEAKKIKKAAKAAVKIQSLQRGRAVRQKAKAAKATKEAQEKELEDFARPATLTESILPEKIGGLQRSLLEAKKDVKNLVDSEGLEKANKKILDLQRVARGRFGRKAAQQAKAAVKIQSLQRERAV
ncbi:hypothetical protein HOD08_03825, partial [bacterium]|nr:hypothetical protein [bacterium]